VPKPAQTYEPEVPVKMRLIAYAAIYPPIYFARCPAGLQASYTSFWAAECQGDAAFGLLWLRIGYMRLSPDGRDHMQLTRREREVMALVALGLSNKEIAGRLGITEGTVKSHLHRIFSFCGVRNRTTLAAIAIGAGGMPSQMGRLQSSKKWRHRR
jgi:DNA-binding CsgD family transcriptional regulator